MNIEITNSIYVDAIWPGVAPLLAPAVEHYGDDLSVGDLWQMCRSGNAFLIIVRDGDVIKAAVIVRFDRWSKGSVLRVIAVGGAGLAEWRDGILDFVTKLASDNGASRVVTEGREGWARVFPALKILRCVYVLEIE
jgi:hypothetical protein